MALRSMIAQWYPPTPTFTEKDLPDQTGKVFIVTGGNAGIGFELCKMLYDSGATIYIASRSEERVKNAIRDIESATPAAGAVGKLRFLKLDLNDLATVKAAATTFQSLESKLDVLIHNAGMSPLGLAPFAKTAQGIEAMVGMHCVAPLLLTHHLLPSLRAAAATSSPGSVRVIWTSSIAAEFDTPNNGIDFSVLETGVANKQQNYGVSKLGNWALAREAARRHGGEGIVHVVLNPGNVRAGSYKGLPAMSYFLLNMLVLKETKMGAYTELFAAFSPEVAEKPWNGWYIIPFGRLRDDSSCHRQDIIEAFRQPEDGGLGYATKFWEWCEDKGREYM